MADKADMMVPDTSDLIRRNRELVERFGPWQRRFELAPGVYTRDPVEGQLQSTRDALLARMVQMVADTVTKPWDQLRVVDLACLEGYFAIAMARKGARVLGIEGREGHVEKAKLLRDAFGLGEKLEFKLDDVRNFTRGEYGDFDVVICSGVFYHLDMPDVMTFLHNMSDACSRCLILDTHVSLRPQFQYTFNGRTYHGSLYSEHRPESTTEERKANPLASLDNPQSFWFSRSSLLNAMRHAGFTTIYEPMTLFIPRQADRVTLVGIKGDDEGHLAADESWPEYPQSLPAAMP